MPLRIILHLDMNSFFASAEQQANPALRGKPIVVSGKEGTRSVIVAASREAKVFGIKTAMKQHEARRLCPQLIFVEPDGVKYDFFHHQLVRIFKKYTEVLEVFSIDEAFLDLTGYAKTFEQAEVIARKIKAEVRDQLGEVMTCSVGIADNKLLAKLASDMKKPDGLVIINEKNKEEILRKIKLTDFCGLGPRINKRLDELGVNSVLKLRNYPLKNLIAEFGEVYGQRLSEMSFGIDYSPVNSYLYQREIKSIGRAYTLPANTEDKDVMRQIMMHLCEKVGRSLRQHGLKARTLEYYFRHHDFTHTAQRTTLPVYVDATLKIFEVGSRLLEKLKLPKPVRLIGVRVSNLLETVEQMSLFSEEQKQQKVQPFVDKINDKYGSMTVRPAFLLKKKRLRQHVGGFKSEEVY